MKFYISSRVKKANQVKDFADKLKSLGHKITLDWTAFESLKPYNKNQKQSAKVSNQMLKAIKNCDVFILLTDRAGTGMYVEFGYALAYGKKIFVAGKHINKSIFFFHHKVKIVNSIEDIMEEI